MDIKFKTIDALDLLKFMKVQYVHHDNFHRADAAEIGHNGNDVYPMEYTDYSEDCPDDENIHIGIADKTLVAFTDNEVPESRHRIAAVTAGGFPYKAVISFEKTAMLAVDIKSLEDFILIKVTSRAISVKAYGSAKCETKYYIHDGDIEVFEAFVFENSILVVIDGNPVIRVSAEITSTICGLHFDGYRRADQRIRSFCVSRPDRFDEVEYDEIQRGRQFGRGLQVHQFDMYYQNETHTADPVVFYQLRHDDDGLNCPGLRPNVELVAINDRLHMRVCGAEDHIDDPGAATSVDYDLGPIKLNAWTHYAIFVRQGYMPEQSPMTSLDIDSKCVAKCDALNAYNSPIASDLILDHAIFENVKLIE